MGSERSGRVSAPRRIGGAAHTSARDKAVPPAALRGAAHHLGSGAARLRRVEESLVGRSGLRVSRLGLGTLTWGRDTDEHEAADQLKQFLEAGGTLVDTAASYGEGAAEELLGLL